MQKMLIDNFGSLRIIELLELENNLRAYSRWVVPLSESHRYERILNLLNMNYLKSDFYLNPIESSANKEEIFHEYMRSSETKNSNSHIVYYLSKTNPLPIKLAEGDHASMGNLLGYPSCCIHSFLDYHNIHAKKIMMPDSVKMHEKLFLTSPYLAHPFYYNLMRRDKGEAILSHIPCSADCKKTHAIGKTRTMILEEHDFELHSLIRTNLSGIHEVKGKRVNFF